LELKTNVYTPSKKGFNLETELVEVRHMSRPKSFYVGSPNSVSKPLSFERVAFS
jgi:hypothetical protein